MHSISLFCAGFICTHFPQYPMSMWNVNFCQTQWYPALYIEREIMIYWININDFSWIHVKKIWNASRICVSSLRRGHANLLCIVPILVYVLPKQVQLCLDIGLNIYLVISSNHLYWCLGFKQLAKFLNKHSLQYIRKYCNELSILLDILYEKSVTPGQHFSIFKQWIWD